MKYESKPDTADGHAMSEPDVVAPELTAAERRRLAVAYLFENFYPEDEV